MRVCHDSGVFFEPNLTLTMDKPIGIFLPAGSAKKTEVCTRKPPDPWKFRKWYQRYSYRFMSAENQLYRTKKESTWESVPLKLHSIGGQQSPSTSLAITWLCIISDLVVKEAQKCPIFRRSGKIHILILWHLQQSSVSSGVQDALLNQSINDSDSSPWHRLPDPSASTITEPLHGDSDGDNHWYCQKLFFSEDTFPSADKGLLQALQDIVRFFPCVFILTELKNIRGWMLIFHVDPVIMLTHLNTRNMPSLLKVGNRESEQRINLESSLLTSSMWILSLIK